MIMKHVHIVKLDIIFQLSINVLHVNKIVLCVKILLEYVLHAQKAFILRVLVSLIILQHAHNVKQNVNHAQV